MTPDLTPMAYAAALIAALLVLGKVALEPSNRLRISVFRPYRGDPWPIGVQEDDDARFAWTAVETVDAEIRPDPWAGLDEVEPATVEDVIHATVDVEVVHPIVRGAHE
jgi:hypothetical protein